MLSVFLLLVSTATAPIVQTRDLKTGNDDGRWRKIGITVSNPDVKDIPLDTARIQYTLRERGTAEVAAWYFQIHSANWQYNVQGVNLVRPTFRRTDDSTLVLDVRFQKGHTHLAEHCGDVVFR